MYPYMVRVGVKGVGAVKNGAGGYVGFSLH
jgi:hypothetical protein